MTGKVRVKTRVSGGDTARAQTRMATRQRAALRWKEGKADGRKRNQGLPLASISVAPQRNVGGKGGPGGAKLGEPRHGCRSLPWEASEHSAPGGESQQLLALFAAWRTTSQYVGDLERAAASLPLIFDARVKSRSSDEIFSEPRPLPNHVEAGSDACAMRESL